MRTVSEFQQYMKMNNMSVYTYLTPFLQVKIIFVENKLCNMNRKLWYVISKVSFCDISLYCN